MDKKIISIYKKIKLIKSKNQELHIGNDIFMKCIRGKDVKKNYIEWMSKNNVIKFTEQRHFKQNKKSIMKYVEEKFKSKNDLFYGIFVSNNEENIHIGNIKLSIINIYDQRADISYLIGNTKYWGKGITTMAVNKILIISKKIGLKKITANCYSNNLGSIKVLKKNDFLLEGHHKQNINFYNKRIDTFTFGKVII